MKAEFCKIFVSLPPRTQQNCSAGGTFKKIRCDHYRRGPSGLDSGHLAREEWAFGLGLGKGKVSSGSRRGIAAALLLFAL